MNACEIVFVLFFVLALKMPVEFVLGVAIQEPVELVQDIALPEVWPLSVKAEMLSAVLYTLL